MSYEGVNFDDLTKRILDNMDKMGDKLDNLCNRMSDVENKLESHFQDIDDRQKGKERKFYYIIALMGIGFTFQEIIRSFL